MEKGLVNKPDIYPNPECMCDSNHPVFNTTAKDALVCGAMGGGQTRTRLNVGLPEDTYFFSKDYITDNFYVCFVH